MAKSQQFEGSEVSQDSRTEKGHHRVRRNEKSLGGASGGIRKTL